MQPSFKDAFRTKDFVVTAELPLTPDSTDDSILADARQLGSTTDGLLLTDNLYGQPHMAPAYAAGVLLRNGFAPILQLSSRNRNRIALIGELLAARAAGIDSLMMVRGGVLPEGYAPRPKAVLDTDAKDLIATAKVMNEDEKLDKAREFLIAAAAAVHDPRPDAVPDELTAKADAGAQLMITQVCMNASVLGRYLDFLVAHRLTHRISIIVSIAIIESAEVAEWLINNRIGTIVSPESIGPTDEVIGRTADYVATIRSIPGVAGVNFAFAGSLDLIPEILDQAGVASRES